MNLSYSRLNISADLPENKINVWTVEKREEFLKLTSELYQQIEGGSGEFYLSDDDGEIKISTVSDIIVSPFLLDMNNRKFHNKVLAELKMISADMYADEFYETRLKLCQYIEKLTSTLPYEVKYDSFFDESVILKALNIKLQDEYANYQEKIVSYITLAQQLLSLKILFVINLKDYFADDQLKEIYKTCFYNKITLIIIESHKHLTLPNETGVILDSDGCVIKY